ncbi:MULTISPECIES: type III effector [Pseudomonas syringae group]|uniref:Type III effector n=1 Tax=Pseudomonas coronafaciens pv. coronafaciens TaxID=235275 RepID=A0AAE6UP94_9PSED|nr:MULTISPECIES: type III effector [Pseudomonas syringae group]KPX31433.1 Type III effector protein AvrPto1 [Pseudomonas coronafaciens pv. garcae]QGT84220.1 type III effector [Pseudomonas coronafaciens pv. coronafaciens]QIQ72101.1 hypothetical protein HBB04_02494 [Pseudomonas coronafaciens]
MGNSCVGGATSARQVYSPDRVSDNPHEVEDVTSSQLLSVRHELSESAGLPRDQHDFVSHQAPESLRNRHNNLYRRTRITLDMADMQHRFITGASGINPEMRPHENVAQMRSAISEWRDMREALQHAMDIHSGMPESGESHVAIVDPDPEDLVRMSTLSSSPYRNW